jgi:hypothetical protein
MERYIYCYRWKSTGIAVYVGSTWDLEQRDQYHVRGNGIPFERLLTEQGREKFTLEIVEVVHGETYTGTMQAAVPRENFWMDELKTWHEHGTRGYNFGRASSSFDSEDEYEAARAAMSTSAKRRLENPIQYAAHVERSRKALRSPKCRRNRAVAVSAAAKKQAQNQKWLVAIRESSEHRKQDPKWLAATRAGSKKRSHNRKWRQVLSLAMKQSWEVRRARMAP